MGRECLNGEVARVMGDSALEAELAPDVLVDAQFLTGGIAREIPGEAGSLGEHWAWTSLGLLRVERGSGRGFFEPLALTPE